MELAELVGVGVSARDEVETIGQGTHERVVVSMDRFEQRVQAKADARTA